VEDEAVIAGCGHAFCRSCVLDFLQKAASTKQTRCPACSSPLTLDLSGNRVSKQDGTAEKAGKKGASKEGAGPKHKRSSILNRINLEQFQSSTKIEALREELGHMIAADSSSKALVFSQFTSMLDLCQFRLQQVGIACVRLEGCMSLDQRDKAISSFTKDPNVRVFLMSLKAGGVALNLTAASHVMLMDPWWNPAVEFQAMDRIHRLGQFKPITVVRFIIGGTIEERILKLQDKKQLVFEGTVGRDAEALTRLTEDDLRFLFS